MAGLLRRQYLITENNSAKLKSLAESEGVPATEIVRRAIDAYNVSKDDAELERLVDMMSHSIKDAVKEVRSTRKLVRKANRDYAERKAG